MNDNQDKASVETQTLAAQEMDHMNALRAEWQEDPPFVSTKLPADRKEE